MAAFQGRSRAWSGCSKQCLLANCDSLFTSDVWFVTGGQWTSRPIESPSPFYGWPAAWFPVGSWAHEANGRRWPPTPKPDIDPVERFDNLKLRMSANLREVRKKRIEREKETQRNHRSMKVAQQRNLSQTPPSYNVLSPLSTPSSTPDVIDLTQDDDGDGDVQLDFQAGIDRLANGKLHAVRDEGAAASPELNPPDVNCPTHGTKRTIDLTGSDNRSLAEDLYPSRKRRKTLPADFKVVDPESHNRSINNASLQ
jgi:hypothetical protein